ncbi:MAG: hypothetical protein ABL982_25000, partial [Vicinamibacterales bacterium]
ARQWRHEEAAAALGRATSVNPLNPFPWLVLSESALALGRDAQAAATLQRALQLESNPAFHRGYAQAAFTAGRNDVAATSTRTYLDNVGLAEQGGQYAAFLGALAEMRRGRRDQGLAMLSEAEAAVRPGTWTEVVLGFLQGKVDANAFLAKAGDVGERTEAHTYMGLMLDLAGRTPEALTHYKWVAAQGARNYTEYRLAKGEIHRLEQASAPPAAP